MMQTQGRSHGPQTGTYYINTGLVFHQLFSYFCYLLPATESVGYLHPNSILVHRAVGQVFHCHSQSTQPGKHPASNRNSQWHSHCHPLGTDPFLKLLFTRSHPGHQRLEIPCSIIITSAIRLWSIKQSAHSEKNRDCCRGTEVATFPVVAKI